MKTIFFGGKKGGEKRCFLLHLKKNSLMFGFMDSNQILTFTFAFKLL